MVPSLTVLAALLALGAAGCAAPPGGPDAGEGGPDAELDAEAAVEDAEAEADGDRQDGGEPAERGELVVVTLNTHSFQEGLDSLDKLARIGEGLAALEADLVGLNEVMSGTFWAYHFEGEEHDGAELVRGALEAASGETYELARCGFAHWADGEEMANVVLSRYPIVEHGCRPLTTTDFWPAPDERRNVLAARVEVPRLGPVLFLVTHTAGYGSADVPAEVAEVRAFASERSRGDEALALVVGDLNAPSGSADHALWLSAPPFALVDTWAAARPEAPDLPTLADGSARIDYVLAVDRYELVEPPPRYSAALVFDGRAEAGPALPVVSDHFGVLVRFPLAAP